MLADRVKPLELTIEEAKLIWNELNLVFLSPATIPHRFTIPDGPASPPTSIPNSTGTPIYPDVFLT